MTQQFPILGVCTLQKYVHVYQKKSLRMFIAAQVIRESPNLETIQMPISKRRDKLRVLTQWNIQAR